MAQRIVVAIDGPAGAGKSTVARAVADRLDILYIDSGAMYRCVALWAIEADVSPSDMHRLEQLAQAAHIQFEPGTRRVLLNGRDVTEAIRSTDVTAVSSRVAAVPAVRRVLVEKQRELAEGTSVVMEGRDIGSVVFPDANVKIFLDAPAVVRAQRRSLELYGAPGNGAAARDLSERDARDRNRAESPLVQAPDAIYLDSDGLAVDEVIERILKVVRERTANGKEYSR